MTLVDEEETMDGLAEALAALMNRRAVSTALQQTPSCECPICGGSGYIVWRENGETFSRECQCEKIRQNKRRIERSGLSDVIQRYRLDNYQTPEAWQKSALQAAKAYIEKKDGWFFFGGSSGAGKTHLCTAICGELMNQGVPTLYLQWRSDIPGIKAKINDVEAYDNAVKRLKNIKCLYIDDFLKGSITEGDRNIAYDILNSRYNRPDRMTIISTELNIQKILQWDEAIGGRIAERSRGSMLNIDGKRNWRLNSCGR